MNVERLRSVSFFLIFLFCCVTESFRSSCTGIDRRHRFFKKTISFYAVSNPFGCASCVASFVPRLYRSDDFDELLKVITETHTNEDTSTLQNYKFKNDFRAHGIAVLVSSLRAFNIYYWTNALDYLMRATSMKISFLNTFLSLVRFGRDKKGRVNAIAYYKRLKWFSRDTIDRSAYEIWRIVPRFSFPPK